MVARMEESTSERAAIVWTGIHHRNGSTHTRRAPAYGKGGTAGELAVQVRVRRGDISAAVDAEMKRRGTGYDLERVERLGRSLLAKAQPGEEGKGAACQ